MTIKGKKERREIIPGLRVWKISSVLRTRTDHTLWKVFFKIETVKGGENRGSHYNKSSIVKFGTKE